MKKRIIAALLVLVMVFALTGCDSADYKEAMELYESGQYAQAEAIFLELGDYEDSAEMANRCRYSIGLEQMNAGDCRAAAETFDNLGDYDDSAAQARKARIKIVYDYIMENGDALSGGKMIAYAYDGAMLGFAADNGNSNCIKLAFYDETYILADFTYSTFVTLDASSDLATLTATHEMELYYGGSYAYSDQEYEGEFAVSQFTRTSKIHLTSYNKIAMNIYGTITRSDDIDDAPTDDLHTHLYSLLDGFAAYLEENNVGVDMKGLGFASWE